MTYKNKIDFLKDYGSKTTVISEIFKEDEKAGKDMTPDFAKMWLVKNSLS